METLEESEKCEKRSPSCLNSPLIAMDEEHFQFKVIIWLQMF